MSVRGGRGARGVGRADARSRALPLLLVVLTLSSTYLALAPLSHAQVPSDPWWGPTDKARPTDGWAVRVPITVENHRDFTMVNPVVLAEVDFGQALVKAGWTNRTAGADVTLRGFTLDVDSIRVVEYGRGFSPGPVPGESNPVPHRFYPALLQGVRAREFDAARNPAGTIAFAIPDALEPGARRFYYVYANPLEYEREPMKPHPYTLESLATIDSFLWGTAGQTFYGWEPRQEGNDHQIRVITLTDKPTRVEILQNSLGRFTPLPSTASFPSSLVLTPTNAPATGTFFVPGNTAWKIVSTHPVLVFQHGRTEPPIFPPGDVPRDAAYREWRGFVASTTGTYAGRDFWVYGGTIDGGAPVVFVRASSGTAEVSITPLGAPAPRQTLPLSASTPIAPTRIPVDTWSRINVTGSAKILVHLGDFRSTNFAFAGYQVPALTGAPVGNDFITTLPVDGGFLQLCSRNEDALLRVTDITRPGQQLEPEGPIPGTDPLKVSASPICRTLRAGASWPQRAEYEVYSVKPADGRAPATFSVLAGATGRAVSTSERPILGYYGGQGATSFSTLGNTGILAHYNDTRITLFVERERNGVKHVTNQTFALSADGFYSFVPAQFAEATGKASIVTTKPVTVVSLESAAPEYGYSVPGRPEPPRATVGAAEFRGPLVELRSREKEGRQDFRSTGPGTPVTFPIEVQNLGRWIGGEGLSDVITLACTPLEGWTVKGCDQEIDLASGTAERVDVTITPPADAINANGTFVVEARSKHGKVVSSLKLIVFVEIRYGVGMWFDVEGGRKSIDPPIGVDPGDTYRYNILIKNTGSAEDSFDLTVEPDARPGWTQALLFEGAPATRVTLAGGESRILHFVVTAPDAETAQQNIVSIKAQSLGSALAADVVNTATRIRPKVSISMALDPLTRVAEPNETATFNVTVTNTGNDIFLVQLKREGLLPAGWNASFNLEPPEVNLNPNPTRDPSLSYTFKLYVTPPHGARAGDLATLKLTVETDTGGGVVVPGDQASAVVVVRKVHNVTTPPLLDAKAEPGEALRYVLPVTNGGNGNDVIELLPGAVEARLPGAAERSPGWQVDADEESLYLDHNETGDLPLLIRVPAGAPPGLYNVTFTMRLSREAFQNLTIPVDVQPTPRIALAGVSAIDLPPGRRHEVQLTATNTGNLAGAYAFAADAPAGWNVTFRPARAQLAPGASMPVTVVVNASRDAQDGPRALTLRSTLAGAPAGDSPLEITIARPDLALERVDASGSTRPGELVIVEASVRNSGSIAADNVSVVLLVDGDAVDQVVLNRIPVGEAKVATLSWTSTRRTSDLVVVVDPSDEIVQRSSTDDDAADVVFANRLTPNPAWLALAALAMAFALFGRRSRR